VSRHLLTALMLMCAVNAHALDLTADTCTATEINTKAAQIVASGSGTLTLPSCPNEPIYTTSITVDGNGSGSITIVGQGTDSTILSCDASTAGDLVMTLRELEYADVSGIGFKGNQGTTGTTSAIYLSDMDNFRIHGNKFYDSRWAAVILMKGMRKGLIDNNYFDNHTKYSEASNYGLSFGQDAYGMPTTCLEDPASHTSCSDDTCDTYFKSGDCSAGTWCHDCETTWNTGWWQDADQNYGYAYPYHTWTPGDDQSTATNGAVYVENNEIHWYGPSFEGNWSSKGALVFRYNTVYTYRNGSSMFALKPGGYFFEAYNNHFEYVGGGAPTNIVAYLRTNGLFYNNYIKNSNLGIQHAAWWVSYGYVWTDYVIMDELFIWNNTEENVLCGDIDTYADCSSEWSEGDNTRIAENTNYFYRAPTTGERIYSGNPAQPVNQYTCPHPLSGLTGGCDNTEFGLAGYNVAGGTPSQTPVLHGATISPGVTLR